MSKLAIFVCALIVASAVHASVIDGERTGRSMFSSAKNKLRKEKENVDSVVDGLVKWINDQVRSAEANANEILLKLKEEATKLEDGVREKVEEAIEKVEKKVKEAAEEATDEDVDVSECTNLIAGVRDAALDLVVGVGACFNGKIEQGAGYIKSMTETTDKILDQIIEIKADADDCIRDVDGITSAIKAIICVNAAGVRATWAGAKQVPALVTDTAKLAVMVAALPPTLTYCVASNSFTTIEERFNDAIFNVRACIAEKLKEANENQKQKEEEEAYPKA